MGMSYSDAQAALSNSIYISIDPNENGTGSIVIKHQEFYRCKGTCSLYFDNNVLATIGITIDWGMYNTDQESFLFSKNIDEAIAFIAKQTEDELSRSFQKVEITKHGNTVFASDQFCIISTISRDLEHYSVIIRAA